MASKITVCIPDSDGAPALARALGAAQRYRCVSLSPDNRNDPFAGLMEMHTESSIDVVLPAQESEILPWKALESELLYLGIRTLLPLGESLALQKALVLYPEAAGETYRVAGVARRGKLFGWIAGHAQADDLEFIPHREDIFTLTRRIIGYLRWDGGFELEFAAGSASQPRLRRMLCCLPAWVDLALPAGLNLPAMQVQLALGHTMEPRLENICGHLAVESAAVRA